MEKGPPPPSTHCRFVVSTRTPPLCCFLLPRFLTHLAFFFAHSLSHPPKGLFFRIGYELYDPNLISVVGGWGGWVKGGHSVGRRVGGEDFTEDGEVARK